MVMRIREWNCNEFGYEEKTSFWKDFEIANNFGMEAVKDTFERAFNEWRDDYIYDPQRECPQPLGVG